MPEVLEQTMQRAFISNIEVRAIDEDSRRATFVIATENEIRTFMGVEVLRMSGVDLKRFLGNPVVLDTHNRFDLGAVIGRAVSVKKEGRTLVADVEFAETERANTAWELVRTDFVRAASVGFIPIDVQVLDAGESDGRGDGRVEGPARVVKKWELTELSIVPVPADVDTLKRSFFEGDSGLVPDLVRTIVQLTEPKKESTAMAKDKELSDAPLESTEGVDRAEILPPIIQPTAAEVATRDLEAHATSIRAITPQGLSNVADECILKNLPLDEARKALLEAHAKRSQPVGTPEPVAETPEGDETEGETRVSKMSDRDFVRAITG